MAGVGQKSCFLKAWRVPRLAVAAAVVAVLATGGGVYADWHPGDGHKMHFPQMPDPIGFDVAAYGPAFEIADDFQCSETGLITDVHIWGSWALDQIGEITNVRLRIYDNIPTGPGGYSIPGTLQWEWNGLPWGVVTQEPSCQWFMVPPPDYSHVGPCDHQQWFQYNFDIPPQSAFEQQAGTIYWLSVQATISENFWGWKSSLDYFMDTAVSWDQGTQQWLMIEKLPEHTPIHLAFVITGEPPQVGACCYDPSGGVSNYACVETDEDDCINTWSGVYQGDGTVCLGMAACCLQNDTCVDADELCCVNELGGQPGPSGVLCSQAEACCLSTTTIPPIYYCQDLDPECCLVKNGIPQGPGNYCSAATIACCLQDGSGGCLDVDPLCCDELGGYASSTHGSCQGGQPDGACLTAPTGACCYPDGTCVEETQADCELTAGAEYKGDDTHCFGDMNGNGIDDLCEQPWQPGDGHKMHFPQLPDPTGWDVYATAEDLVLADDWMCSETGWIRDIHFWGSWKGDVIGEIEYFILSFHYDIPADQSQTGYSMPGDMAGSEVYASDFVVTEFDPPTAEGWYDPSTGEVLPGDHYHYFQYDVYLPEDVWWQDEGTIYWLNITAVLDDSAGIDPAYWGWKSSIDHWMDDAVWGEWWVLDWYEIYEPYGPVYDDFWIWVNEYDELVGGGGSGYNEGWWYWYENTEWWNEWFYDHPYYPDRWKQGWLNFFVHPYDAQYESWITVALNYSTPQWSWDDPAPPWPPDERQPPLPPLTPAEEDMYIDRDIVYEGSVPIDGYYYDEPFYWGYYNPEWVSIDVTGSNFAIDPGSGFLAHDCMGSLDLAFVITGGDQEPEGACCYPAFVSDDDRLCVVTTQSDCEDPTSYDGVYQGDGSVCGGMEACCMPDGSCVYADALCCRNELFGTPAGPGTTCSGNVTGCCLTDGTCEQHDETCCVFVAHGTVQTQDCYGYTEACCLDVAVDPDCIDVDPVCCDDESGQPSPSGATACLGDQNGNGQDDACEEPQACCLPDGSCVDTSHVDCVSQGGDPQGPGTECATTVCNPLKWAQPPTFNPESPRPDCFWGWDEPSIYGWTQIVADDFLCETPNPITDIHWWASYLNYSDDVPPMGPGTPIGFHIGIWTDIPAPPWSHPGQMIWQWIVPRDILNERPVGCDLYPEMMVPDTCFRYDFIIPEGEWFYQDEFTSGEPTVFWISIAAQYTTEPALLWGWKTRQPHWNDDAVRIFYPTQPDIVPFFEAGEPIENFEGSWDMAFVLTTASTAPDPPDPESPPIDKNRYISFVPANPGVQTALRVTLTSMPPPFTGWNGTQFYVGPDFDTTEQSGSSGSTPTPAFNDANLQVAQYCQDWGAVGPLHVTGHSIVPSAVYDVQTVDCATSAVSTPLTIGTPIWGDIVGDFVAGAWTPPDGVVDFKDIAAMVDKFKNLPTAPVKARTDLSMSLVDRVIDFVDISNDVDAFKNKPYPYGGPNDGP